MAGLFSGIAQYFLAGFVGFFIGVVLSCILLAKKNIAMEKEIEAQVEKSIENAKKTYQEMTTQEGIEYYEEEFELSELDFINKENNG